jgi:hypothetical protein
MKLREREVGEQDDQQRRAQMQNSGKDNRKCQDGIGKPSRCEHCVAEREIAYARVPLRREQDEVSLTSFDQLARAWHGCSGRASSKDEIEEPDDETVHQKYHCRREERLV